MTRRITLSASQKNLQLASLFTLGVLLLPTLVMAFTAPVAADFGFAVYTFIMDKMLAGALGILLTAVCCGMGIYACINRQMGGIPVGVGFFALAAAIYNIKALAISFGAMV